MRLLSEPVKQNTLSVLNAFAAKGIAIMENGETRQTWVLGYLCGVMAVMVA
jgi:hypothetical protein